MELVPGTLIDLDKKDFDWQLTEYTSNEIIIQILFSKPEAISYDKPDTMIITFMNTPFYMMPKDKTKQPIPNGYKLTVPLPVQFIPKTISEQTVEEQLKGLIITNFFLAFAFGISLQELLGLINSLQIVAHLPLNNVPLPANCYFMFDILVKIVSFDFFPIHQYFDC